MSVKLMSHVWELALTSYQQAVLLVLTDHANDDGYNAYPSVDLIAWKVGCSRRTVQRSIAELREMRVLELSEKATFTRPNVWRVRLDMAQQKPSFRGGDSETPRVTGGSQGVTLTTERGDTAQSPEPSVTTIEPPERTFSMTYQRKKVPADVVADALELLEHFNRESGQALGAKTRLGQPSPALKQIVGGLVAHEASLEDWAAAVKNTFANPPDFIGDRPIQIGDVFGPKAAHHALANKGHRKIRGPQVPAAGDCRRCRRRPRLMGSTHCAPCRDELERELTGEAV